MTSAHRLLQEIEELRASLDDLVELTAEFDEAADQMAQALAAGGIVLVAGNGGSAAESVHLSSELVGRLSASRERAPLPAVALVSDPATMTALANDYGFEQVFARQVAALGRRGDVLVVLSTSGASANLVAAVEAAEPRGVITIGLLGRERRRLHELCRVVLAVPGAGTAAIQECHLVLVHALVAAVEDRLAASGR
jgi:D-sedoheptulose 7-phosphate isomerase